MEFGDIFDKAVNWGLAGIIVVYFLYRDNKYNAAMLETLAMLKEAVTNLTELVKEAIKK